ncbi:phosphoglucosamine mutase [Tyzzerella sp. OttesenSCG-928-J15]|nr:phosphoglucosamine mutase [Tyzzerella sp. OttesenSCG-928-J15]
MGKLFGTDGARGVANSELSPTLAYKIGRAAAFVLSKEKAHEPVVLVGMDTRISGTMLGAALSAGVCSVGGKVINIGVIPTPGIAYLVRKMNADAGVVISASHNPVEYNGIKIFNSKGYKLRDELEEEIEAIVFAEEDNSPVPTGSAVGSIEERYDAVNEYIEFLLGIYPSLNLEGFKIAIDCAEGATYKAAPEVFKRLGADVSVLHNKPDGKNINEKCGSTHMGELSEFVKNGSYHIGIAFDGDGDRCLMVDEKGNMIDGDQIMSFCACYMKEEGHLKGDTLVVTVMSNLGLFIMGDENGINIEKTAVGDRYVLERMLEINASIGGEQSGHVIFLDHNTTGDGILTAVSVLNIMKNRNASISALNTKMKVMPQVLVGAKVENSKKYDFDKNEEIKAAIEKLEKMFDGKGRVLIRASGTEPLVRVMIEGEDVKKLEIEANNMKDLIEKHLG